MRRVLAGLIVAFSVACLGEGLTGSSTITGDYTLRTVNGSPLPYTISGSGANRTEIVGEVITLYQGGTYARSRESRIVLNGQVTSENSAETGSYTLLGTSVTLVSAANGQPTLASINANTMTIVKAGMTAVFTK
jgi:hypothetical protein